MTTFFKVNTTALKQYSQTHHHSPIAPWTTCCTTPYDAMTDIEAAGIVHSPLGYSLHIYPKDNEYEQGAIFAIRPPTTTPTWPQDFQIATHYHSSQHDTAFESNAPQDIANELANIGNHLAHHLTQLLHNITPRPTHPTDKLDKNDPTPSSLTACLNTMFETINEALCQNEGTSGFTCHEAETIVQMMQLASYDSESFRLSHVAADNEDEDHHKNGWPL